MSVAVQRDRDRRVSQVGAQDLGVDPGGDPDAGEGMAALMESERRQPGFFPLLKGPLAKGTGSVGQTGCLALAKSSPSVG